ncbi:MAG TPA: molybdopterin-binding protein [Chloroflexaceae bacterium]|nr:molybdopterin-binding protein [Chloroflexaceae bacterium]
MRLETLPLDAAAGHILCHNLADAQGRKAFAKGRVVRPEDVPRLAELGLRAVRVAVLEPGDVHENEAAGRLAAAVAGEGIVATPAHAGRVNLRAAHAGPLAVHVPALLAINELDGLTVATLPAHSLARPGRDLATIKVIPFAVPEADLRRAEEAGRAAGGVLRVRPISVSRVGVVLVSSPAARLRVERGVYPAIEGRVAELGGAVFARHAVAPDEGAVAEAVAALAGEGAELVIVAGETSVMDLDDVTPRGIRLAGGRVEHYGAPVEPGNLLLMAYLDRPGGPLPILGAPGCVRSRDANIVDLLLPRLMAGERVGRGDIVALGHGGLLG